MKPHKKPAKKKSAKPTDVSVYGFRTGLQIAGPLKGKIGKGYAARQSDSGLAIIPPPALIPGSLTVVCALPGQGKSAYLLNLALERQKLGCNVGVFLPDDTADEFMLKAVCLQANAKYDQLQRGSMPREKRESVNASADKLSKPGLYFSKRTTMTAQDIAREAAELSEVLRKAGRKLDTIILDSLNYIKEEELGLDKLEYLKAMAKQLQLSVVCSLSLRETKNMRDGWVRLADVRAAGIDEQYTDQVLFLQRPGLYDYTDPTLRDKAVLRRLYPAILGCPESMDFIFNYRTLAFTRVSPGLPPLQEEELA